MRKHVPNTITCCNLVCGCVAVTLALTSRYEMAFLFIVLGAVFDFFDGMTARLLGVSSPIGKELDSLADDVTFGVAPASMVFMFLYNLGMPDYLGFAASVIPYFAFIIAAFSALRLAKFNLDTRQTTSFIGVPTPANSLFWASLIVGSREFLEQWELTVPVILALIALTSWALVAELPMFALKFKQWGWRGNEIKYIFIIGCVPLLAVFRLSGFAAVIIWYVLLSIIDSRKPKAEH